MKNKLMLLFLIFIVFAACSNPKMDASTEETTKESISKLREALPEPQRPEFDEAIQTLLSNSGTAKGSSLASAEITEEVRARIEGKNATQIIAEASQVKAERERHEQELVKQEIEKLEAKYQAFTYANEQLGRIKILSSGFYVVKNAMREERPVIELRVKNDTPYPVYRAYFEFSLTGPGIDNTSNPMKFHYDIPNGLLPGTQSHWHLSSETFSDWDNMKIPKKPVVNISIVRIDGPDGNALFAQQGFSEQEKTRLAELKQKYGKN